MDTSAGLRILVELGIAGVLAVAAMIGLARWLWHGFKRG